MMRAVALPSSIRTAFCTADGAARAVHRSRQVCANISLSSSKRSGTSVRGTCRCGAGPEDLRPSSSSSSSCLKISRSVSSSEIVEHHGTVIVAGNVSNGAIIRADGDIIVLGKLEGEAHAGRNGDVHATIFASSMLATSVNIAGCKHQLANHGDHTCQVASLLNGQIRIHPMIITHPKPLFKHLEGNNVVNAHTMERSGRSWLLVLITSITSMRKPSKVAIFTGAYIFIVGVALFLFPEPLFGMFFDLRSVSRLWIRVGAVLAVVFGIYYIGTALGESIGYTGADSFYISTVIGRMAIFLSFSWLVAAHAASIPLFFVGLVNLIGALTMLKALQSDTMVAAKS